MALIPRKEKLLHEHGSVYIIVLQNGLIKYTNIGDFFNFQTLDLPGVCVVQEIAEAYVKELQKKKSL